MNLHDPSVAVPESKQALTYLKEGNERFVNDKTMPRDTNKADRDKTSGGQKPFAAILTCADSRVAPEIYFDQKIGDIFVCRNAGNIADQSVRGSFEFAAAVLGVKLIVVVGHSACGAVINAYNKASGLPDNLQAVLDGIQPNVAGSPDAEAGAWANVRKQVEDIANNPVVKEKGIPVVGAKYDIATGKVTFEE